MIDFTPTRLALAAAVAMGICGSATARDAFIDVGEQAPITVLINASPWYKGYEAAVALYEEQTGNKVNLEVTPFAGMLEKARAAVRSGGESPLDLINLNSTSTVEFYAGGFLIPLQDVDPDFKVPAEVYSFGDSGYWDAAKTFRTASTGKLYGYSPNGNIPLLVYRGDALREKGLKVPATFDEIHSTCKALKGSNNYGFVQRGERGESIYFDFMPYFLSYGGKIEADAENGDFTVTVNSPEAKAALDAYVAVSKDCGPANYGSLAQGDLIQLLQTGKALAGEAVVASFSNFEDPKKSAVVGKIEAAPLPRASADREPGVPLGDWVSVIPKNASDAGKKGAIAFSKWFLTYEAQYAYAEAGGIPVRADVFASDLKDRPEFRWFAAYQEGVKHGKQLLGYTEGPAIKQAFGLRLNQALIGELSTAEALNKAAADIEEIFERSGRKTGTLAPLTE